MKTLKYYLINVCIFSYYLLIFTTAHANDKAVNTVASGGMLSKFQDVISTPAKASHLVAKNLMQAVASKGNLLLAVGQRGHILRSTDQGKNWQQIIAPTSVDLLAINIVNEKNIWVSGHDGIIMHSNDGGMTWKIQLDGVKANQILVDSIEKRVAAEPTNANLLALQSEVNRYKSEGANKPFLDIWFADEKLGVAVGAYGLIFVTEDGGENWLSWFDQVENPKFYHYNAISGTKDFLIIAGEAGKVWQLDLVKKNGRLINTPYNGSFFDVIQVENEVMVVGMRGNVWKAKNTLSDWKQIEIGVKAGVSQLFVAGDKSVYLTTQNSKVFRSTDSGNSFTELKLKTGIVYAGISVLEQNPSSAKLVLVGFGGLKVEEVSLAK